MTEGGLTKEQIYLCRASGEGAHQFRFCESEAEVMAFYEEMFGKDMAGIWMAQIKHFRDPDNWSNNGTAYSVDLYNATWEVWKAERSDLALRATEQAEDSFVSVKTGETGILRGAAPSPKEK